MVFIQKSSTLSLSAFLNQFETLTVQLLFDPTINSPTVANLINQNHPQNPVQIENISPTEFHKSKYFIANATINFAHEIYYLVNSTFNMTSHSSVRVPNYISIIDTRFTPENEMNSILLTIFSSMSALKETPDYIVFLFYPSPNQFSNFLTKSLTYSVILLSLFGYNILQIRIPNRH